MYQVIVTFNGRVVSMEHVFKVRSSEFIEDETWNKGCIGEFKNASSQILDRKSKRDVCYFEIDPVNHILLYKILRSKEFGQIKFSVECPGKFMFAWSLYLKDSSSGNNPMAFDPVVIVYAKVSNTTGDIRSMKQKFHGVLSTDQPLNVVEMKPKFPHDEVATAIDFDSYDEVVDLINEGNFFYLCQRNNFQLTEDHFAEIVTEDQLADAVPGYKHYDSDKEPGEAIVLLKYFNGISLEETSNNIEIELVKLIKKSVFRHLLEQIIALHGMDESCLQFYETQDETIILVYLRLLQHLVQFIRDILEERKNIIADVKKSKIILGVFRFFNEYDSVQPDTSMTFRLKLDRSKTE